MKKRTFTALWIFIFAPFINPSAQAENFDEGGVTFPMEKISAERFAPSKKGEINLLKNADFSAPLVRSAADGWSRSVWIFGEENRRKFTAEARKLASAAIADTGEGKALELKRPTAIETLMGKLSDKFSIAVNQTVTLPDEAGGSFRLTFESRNQIIGNNRYDQMVLLNFHDGSDPRPGRGKKTRSYIYSQIASSAQWHPYNYEFNVPPGTRDLAITLRADGCGKIQFRDIKLVKLDALKMPFTVELAPMKLLDNTFALASGAPGILAFKFRNNFPERTPNSGTVMMNLILPAEISVDGTNLYLGKEIKTFDLAIDGKKWKRREFEVSGKLLSLLKRQQGFNGWNVASVMISGNAPAGTTWKDCRYCLTVNGKSVSGTESFTLKMLPPIPGSPAPKQFYPGFSSVNHDIIFHQEEANKRFAEFVGKTGVTLITSGISPEYSSLMRKNGVRLITAECFGIANGYRIGLMDMKKKPAYSNYLDKDGKPVWNHTVPATCPMAIYNRTPYYRDVVLPYLKDSLAGRDGIQPNWEPYSFLGKGCFCDNCRAEFAKYLKMPVEKVKEIWPDQLLPGGRYREQAIRFRAHQHGRLIRTLHEDCLKFGATEVGFCPEVGTDQIIRSPDHFKQQWEFTPYEYAGNLKWLNVWGPYVWFLAGQPYAYTKGANLITLEMARRVIADFRKHFPDPAKRAKLMAMPHASQGGITALGQPEGMAMDQLSSFLAGYDASILYFFPRGYDHRFWNAFAKSNALIAANEDMVMNGKRRDSVTAHPQSPFPGPVKNINPRFLPDVESSDLLQCIAFEKDGKILAAVGNFWEKAPAVFQLRIPDLEAKRQYLVLEKAFHRQFVPEKGKFYTGKMLAEGILLPVGALRWSFFEIAPALKNPARAVTAADMRAELARCRKENRSAAEEEAARDKALHAESDIGMLKSMSYGALSCKEIKKNAKPMLEVVSGENILILNPSGMALESWKVDGIFPGRPGFGLSAFWTPGRHGMRADGNYRITGQKISAEGLSVTGELKTNVRNYPLLPGLRIVKTVTISPDLRRVVFSVKLHNTLELAMNEVGCRWHFIPAAWSNRAKGWIENGGKKIPRPNICTLLNANASRVTESVIRRLFHIGETPSIPVRGNTFRFVIPDKSVVKCSFRPADSFAGAAVWDTGGMIAATFEPFYNPLMIPPGGAAGLEAVLEVTQ